MPQRNLKIVKPTYPLTGTCDECNAYFLSRNENQEVAAKHIQDQFDAHNCEVQSGYNDPIKLKQSE